MATIDKRPPARTTAKPAARPAAATRPTAAAQSRGERSTTRVAYVAGGIAALAVALAIGALALLRPDLLPLSKGDPIAFAQTGPFFIQSDDYSFNATVAIQTDSADARWARNNKERIDVALQQILAETDPLTLKAPGGLEAAQQSLAAALNQRLGVRHVQVVLFTDFIIEAN